MIVVLVVLNFILIYWVTRLSARVDDLKRTAQYNFDVQNQKFQDIEDGFKFEKEQYEHLLDRIHDLERDLRK